MKTPPPTENIFQTQDRKSRNILLARTIFGLLLAVGVVAAALLNAAFAERSRAELTVQNYAQEYQKGALVKITTNDFDYSGQYEYEKNEDKPTAYYYYAFLEDDDNLYAFVIKNKADYREDGKLDRDKRPARTFYGKVVANPYETSDREDFAAFYEISMGRADDVLQNNMVSDDGEGKHMYIQGWMIAAAPLGILGLVNSSFLRQRKKRLRAMEALGVTESSYASFDREMQSAQAITADKITVTEHWLFNRLANNTCLLPLKEVVWAHKTVTQHSTNGVPTGKTYSVQLYISDGSLQTVQSNAKNIDALMNALAQRCTQAVIGFSEELKTAWAKDKSKDKAEFMALVRRLAEQPNIN